MGDLLENGRETHEYIPCQVICLVIYHMFSMCGGEWFLNQMQHAEQKYRFVNGISSTQKVNNHQHLHIPG